AAQRVMKKLIDLGLIEEVRGGGDLPVWRGGQDGGPLALRITSGGRKEFGSAVAGRGKTAFTQARDLVFKFAAVAHRITSGGPMGLPSARRPSRSDKAACRRPCRKRVPIRASCAPLRRKTREPSAVASPSPS